MFCPKCRTEYRKGFTTCADCDIPLVEKLPQVIDQKPIREIYSPALKLINKALESLRNNKTATWAFIVLFGIFYYYAYLYVKHFWAVNIHRIEFVASFFDLNSELTNSLFTISLGLVIDLTSATVAALVCGIVYVYILKKRQLIYAVGPVIAFFLWYIRHWRFWKAPDIGMKISAFIGPFVPSLIFILVVWGLMKFSKRFMKENI